MALSNLDRLVEGGIPQETVTILSGSPGTGKSTVALQLMSEHLARGGDAIHVTTEVSPTQILQRAQIVGMPLRDHVLESASSRLWFLDCYSWRTGKPSAERSTTSVPTLADLSGLSIHVTDALERQRGRGKPLLVIFDTPSTLSLHASGPSILKFLEVTFAKVKGTQGSLVVPLEKDMHDEQFLAAASTMSDGVVSFKLAEENDDLVRYLRVMSMRTAPAHSSKWTKVRLSKAGAELEAIA